MQPGPSPTAPAATRLSPAHEPLRTPASAGMLALALAAMSRGPSTVSGLGESLDAAAMARALRALGAKVFVEDRVWHITGLGAGLLLEPADNLDFGTHGAGLPLVMGMVGMVDFLTGFVGEGSLLSCDFAPLLAALVAIGGRVREQRDGFLPIALRGPLTPVPFDHALRPDDPPEVRDALLLAALGIPGTSTLRGVAGDDEIVALLRGFGASVEVSDETIEVLGLPDLRGREVVLEGGA